MKPGDRVEHKADWRVGVIVSDEEGRLYVECPRCAGVGYTGGEVSGVGLGHDCPMCRGERSITFDAATRHLSAPCIAVRWDGTKYPFAERKGAIEVMSVVDVLAELDG